MAQGVPYITRINAGVFRNLIIKHALKDENQTADLKRDLIVEQMYELNPSKRPPELYNAPGVFFSFYAKEQYKAVKQGLIDNFEAGVLHRIKGPTNHKLIS